MLQRCADGCQTRKDAKHHSSLEKCKFKLQRDIISHPLGQLLFRNQKKQVLAGMGSNGNICVPLMGI